jgi:hypothetical protein
MGEDGELGEMGFPTTRTGNNNWPITASNPPAAILPANLPAGLTSSQQTLAIVGESIVANPANLTGRVLEIDVLLPSRRRELFEVIFAQLGFILADLRASNVPLPQLTAKSGTIVEDLWQRSLTAWLGNYLELSSSDGTIEVVPQLLKRLPSIRRDFLAALPNYGELWGYYLYQESPLIDGILYPSSDPIVRDRVKLTTDRLIVTVANAIVSAFLNSFGDRTDLCQRFWQPEYYSSRRISEFRNHLSWEYKIDRYWREPKAIFESRDRNYTFADSGIKLVETPRDRRAELDLLSGIPLLVTLAIEWQDALSPPFRVLGEWCGRTIVFLLTEIVGKGLGLIGRGIVNGLGNIRP